MRGKGTSPDGEQGRLHVVRNVAHDLAHEGLFFHREMMTCGMRRGGGKRGHEVRVSARKKYRDDGRHADRVGHIE